MLAVGLTHVWLLPRVAAGVVGKAANLLRARTTPSIIERTCIPVPLLSLQVLKGASSFPKRCDPQSIPNAGTCIEPGKVCTVWD